MLQLSRTLETRAWLKKISANHVIQLQKSVNTSREVKAEEWVPGPLTKGQNGSPLPYISKKIINHPLFFPYYNWNSLCNQGAFFKNEIWKKERKVAPERKTEYQIAGPIFIQKKPYTWPSSLSGLWHSRAHTHLHLWFQRHQEWFRWVKTNDLAIINSVYF